MKLPSFSQMHSFDPHWFAKKVTWNLSTKSRAVMGKRWCDSIDNRQSGSDSQR